MLKLMPEENFYLTFFASKVQLTTLEMMKFQILPPSSCRFIIENNDYVCTEGIKSAHTNWTATQKCTENSSDGKC